MKVVFENSYGERREIGRCKKQEEAMKIINNFLNEHNYKSYYCRMWVGCDEDGAYTKVDVGSWSEFFYIYTDEEEENEEDCN